VLSVAFEPAQAGRGRTRRPVLAADVSAPAERVDQREQVVVLHFAVVRLVTIGHAGRSRGPRLPGVPWRHEHWSLAPRTSETPAAVRARLLRDDLRARVAMLISMEGWGRPEMSRETERRTRPTAVEGHHPFIPMRPFRITPLVTAPH